MKITELAQTTTLNDDDVFPVVQDGETKKVRKKDILVQGDMNENDENSPAFIKNKPDWNKFQTEPNAKSITYNRDLFNITTYNSGDVADTINGYYCRFRIEIPVLKYSVVNGEIVTEDVISDYRPVKMLINDDGEPRISIGSHCLDVYEEMYISFQNEEQWVSQSDIEETLSSMGCTKFIKNISADRTEDSETSGIGNLLYIYVAYFTDKAARDVVYDQFFKQLDATTYLFTADFVEMTEKETEVINNG